MMQYPKIQPVSRAVWRLCLYVPGTILALLTVGFWIGDWDRELVSKVFQQGEFIYRDSLFCLFTYEFASWPGNILGAVCLLYFIVALVRRRKSDLRRITLGVSLSILLGPGVVVNFVFKDNYGRPRPKQVEQFGGEMDYLPVLVPGNEKYARSFPSGHSSSGYVLLVLFLAGLSVGISQAWWVLAFAIPYGTLIGIVRVLQGAHWPSDVLWSCGIVYYCALAVFWGLGIFRPVTAEQGQ